MSSRIACRPLTPERWADFEKVLGPRGAYGGCWCMYWRLTRAEFAAGQGESNRRAIEKIVKSGRVPGVLAYLGKEPVGWCSVAPREDFPSLARSPVLRPMDDKPVWSIVCFFIPRGHRGEGVGEELVKGAVRYARSRGARIVEAYPTVPRGRELAPVSSYMGTPSMFARAGFVECARPSRAKMIMRYIVKQEPRESPRHWCRIF